MVASDGWTKLAMQKMRKLDSFMREAQRYNGLSLGKWTPLQYANILFMLKLSCLASMGRKAVVDYTLSDGTFLPKGTLITCNAVAVHREASHYPNPDEFDGFRFANIRAEVEGESAKNQLVATSTEYLTFGHGRHAW